MKILQNFQYNPKVNTIFVSKVRYIHFYIIPVQFIGCGYFIRLARGECSHSNKLSRRLAETRSSTSWEDIACKKVQQGNI